MNMERPARAPSVSETTDKDVVIDQLAEDVRAAILTQLPNVSTFYDVKQLLRKVSDESGLTVALDSGEVADIEATIIPILDHYALRTRKVPEQLATGIAQLDQVIEEIREREAAAFAQYRNEVGEITHPHLRETVPLHKIESGALPHATTEDQDERPRNVVLVPGCATGPVQLQQFAVECSLQDDKNVIWAPEVFVPSDAMAEYQPGVESGVPQTEFTSAYAASINATTRTIRENPKTAEAPVDLVAYSAGAVAAIAEAIEHPEQIRSITLVNPAGLTNTSQSELLNSFRVGWGAMRQGIEMWQAKVSTPVRDKFTEQSSARQEERGNKELMSILQAVSKTDLIPLIRYLQEEHNVRVSVVTSVDDVQFDYDTIRAAATEAGIAFHGVTGLHGEIGNNPSEMARVIADAIEIMEVEQELINNDPDTYAKRFNNTMSDAPQ